MVYACLMRSSTSRIAFFISILQFNVLNSSNPIVDQWHLSREGDCGIKPPVSSVHGKSRITNSGSSSERFPWAIQVTRREQKIEAGSIKEESGTCGGTIISKK